MSKLIPNRGLWTAWMAAAAILCVANAGADTIPVTVLDSNLTVSTFVGTGLAQPIGICVYRR